MDIEIKSMAPFQHIDDWAAGKSAGKKAILVVRNGHLYPELGERLTDRNNKITTQIRPLIACGEERTYEVIVRGYSVEEFVDLVKLLAAGEIDEFNQQAAEKCWDGGTKIRH